MTSHPTPPTEERPPLGGPGIGGAGAGGAETGRSEGFFSTTVRRPIGLGVAFLTLIVIGVIAYARIPLQLLPSGMQSPSLFMWVPNDGSGSQENEEKVARPIEEQLGTLAGIDSVVSTSREGIVTLRVAFDASLDIDLAKAEVRDRLERARPQLPDTVDKIELWSEDADQFPIAFFGLLNPGDSERTDFLIETIIRPRLEAVPGISKIDVFGMLDDSVRILLDEDAILAGGLDVGALIRRLSADNFASPLGELDDGGQRLLLRSDMRFDDLSEIENFPIGNGLVLSDVGRVIRAKSVRDSLSRIDGNYAYFGVARKGAEANVVDASRELVAAFRELEQDPRLDGLFSFLPFFLQGLMIENSLAQLRSTAMWGGALALIVLLLFLRRIRLTLCVALSIPVSALLALAWEYFTGGSFNLLTMTGITLGIGMLVDNSVVLVENIARHRAAGAKALEAATLGAREIALAVTLATSTTVVVFLPLIFMNSNPETRVIFGGIGLPLCISLVFSLLVAVVFLPVVAARILGPRPASAERVASVLAKPMAVPGHLLAFAIGGLRATGYAIARAGYFAGGLLLGISAPRPAPYRQVAFGIRLLLGAGLVFAGLQASRALEVQHEELVALGLGGFPKGQVYTPLATGVAVGLLVWLIPGLLANLRGARPARPKQFVPSERSPLGLVVAGNGHILAWALRNRFGAAVVAMLFLVSIGIPFSKINMVAFANDSNNNAIEYFVRFDTDFTLAESAAEMRIHEDYLNSLKEEIGFDHLSARFDPDGGSLNIYFDESVPPSKRRQYQRKIKEGVPRPPGHRIGFEDAENASERSANLARFEIRGPDSRVLEDLGREAATLLEQIEGLENVSTPIENAPDQLVVRIDRDKAAQMDVNSETALTNISWALRGWPLPRFMEDSREIPLILEYDSETVAGLSTVRDLQIFNQTEQVSLASISDLDLEPASRSIRRVDGQTNYELTAEISDPARLGELTQRGYAALAELDLPRGFSLGLDNSAVARGAAESKEMLMALLLSVVLVFLLMGILFESLLLPFSVLLSIPFAICGAFWTVYLTGTTMDVMGWIGLIILAGVVVNNGIVLIDRIHRTRNETGDRDSSVRSGTADRVRPVLMTALTTVFGLLPMIVTEPPSESIDYRALGAIVAGGLIASTIFTLWVVPLAYAVLDDLGLALRSMVRRGVEGRLSSVTFELPADQLNLDSQHVRGT